MSQAATPYLKMAQAITEEQNEALKNYYQYGTCAGACPWTITNFKIRKNLYDRVNRIRRAAQNRCGVLPPANSARIAASEAENSLMWLLPSARAW
jgi:hypothetical protein